MNIQEKEKIAVDNLVIMSCNKTRKTLPTFEIIQDILNCKTCYDSTDPVFVNIFLLCSFMDDFTLLREYEQKRQDSLIKLRLPITKDSELTNTVVKKKAFGCDICKEIFSSKNGFNYHLKYVHSAEKNRVVKPYTCPFSDCTKKYKNKNGLYYHLTHHHVEDCDNVEAVYANCIKDK